MTSSNEDNQYNTSHALLRAVIESIKCHDYSVNTMSTSAKTRGSDEEDEVYRWRSTERARE